MNPQADQPIHWDRHKGSLNITLVLALIIAVFGLITALQGGPPLLLIAGAAVAAYSWLTSPQQYYIYRDALIIVYGRPRTKAIPFASVSHIELLSLPMGDRLRVQLIGGRPVILAARDSDIFRERLDTALEEFRTDHPEEETGDGPYQVRPPY